MAYTILNRREEITVKTEVEYTFEINGENHTVTTIVSHFMPQSEEDIVKGIENRALTEQKNIEDQLLENGS